MSENVLVVTFEVTVKEEYAWDSMGRAKAEFAVPKGFLHAIDPGNIESAWVLIDDKLRPIRCAKEENEVVRMSLVHNEFDHDVLAMEEIIGRKWSGAEVTQTAFWSGRLCEASAADFALINRSKIRWHIGKEKKTNDTVIITRLIERFCHDLFKQFVSENITRRKLINAAKKKYFHGFKDDIWQAYAVGITYIDLNQ